MTADAMHLTAEERVARARADLRIGAPVVLTAPAGVGSENLGPAAAVILAAETLSAERVAALADLAPSAVDLVITGRRAETLRARAYDGDVARIVLDGAALRGIDWIRATADPSVDMATPLKGPYLTRRGGGADLHRLAIVLAKQARLLPAVVVASFVDPARATTLAAEAGLCILDAATVQGAAGAAIRMRRVAGARVPLALARHGRVHVFRPDDGGEEHYAVEVGQPDRALPVLARLHSACFT
ncbi:MAG: GTP cyclohydrolase II, partial [Pseudomonadota bacterium]